MERRLRAQPECWAVARAAGGAGPGPRWESAAGNGQRPGRQDEPVPERAAQLAGDGVRHRRRQHPAKLPRPQLPLGEAVHRQPRPRERAPGPDLWRLDPAVISDPLSLRHRHPQQNPLLHHTFHLLFGPCSLPVRGLHLPHCSLDNWSYGTSHGSKFLYLGDVDWAAVPGSRSTVTKQEEKLKLRALCRSALSVFTVKFSLKLSLTSLGYQSHQWISVGLLSIILHCQVFFLVQATFQLTDVKDQVPEESVPQLAGGQLVTLLRG